MTNEPVEVKYTPYEKFMMDATQATFKEVASLNNKATFIMVLIVLSIIAGILQGCGLIH